MKSDIPSHYFTCFHSLLFSSLSLFHSLTPAHGKCHKTQRVIIGFHSFPTKPHTFHLLPPLHLSFPFKATTPIHMEKYNSFNWDASNEWKSYIEQVTIPDPSKQDEIVEKLKRKWYKKNIVCLLFSIIDKILPLAFFP